MTRFVTIALAIATASAALRAQTDYYNTDAGRPILIEDAYALERRGFELQVAPLRLTRARNGVYTWGVEPELAFGILNRTQIEFSVPLAHVDQRSPGGGFGVSGVELSVLHTLNTETSLPAFAVAADVLLPVGRFAPDRAYASVKSIMTRTFPALRVHLNAQYTFGRNVNTTTAAPIGAVGQSVEVSRWVAGAAVDRPIALKSLLLTAEVYARKPLDISERVEWNAGAGVRHQLSPRWAMDAGIGRALTGTDHAWFLTGGGAYAFGLPWRAR
jgi:Putative MetA-pathway of phenol degradation